MDATAAAREFAVITVVPIDQANVATINNVARQNLRRVVAWSTPVEVVATTAGQTVSFRHDLGTVPDRLYVMPWQDSGWWAGIPERALWTAKSVAFSVSAPGRYTVSVGRM